MPKLKEELSIKIKHLLLFSRRFITYLSIGSKMANFIALILSAVVIQAFIYEIGFQYSSEIGNTISIFYDSAIKTFTVIALINLASNYFSRTMSEIKTSYFIIHFLLICAFIPLIDRSIYPDGDPLIIRVLTSYPYQISILLLISILNISTSFIGLLAKKTSPPLILMISFATIIMVGAILLLMPNSTKGDISLIDALFVSTSAVCVTGLVPFEISEVFTTMGQWIILVLIQIGGLGLMTLTSFFTLFFMGNTSIYNQIAVSDMISAGSLNSLLSTLIRILGVTFGIEILGFFIIWYTIHGTMGVSIDQEIQFAVFHSISAFCNAGFSTLPGNLTNPILTGNSSFFVIISFIIILGGIGFPIIINFSEITYNKFINFCNKLRKQKNRQRRRYVYNINTKIVLITTFLLLLGGATAIAVFEWDKALAGMSVSEKLAQVFFNATTPRTAGFNTLDMASFSMQTTILTLFLMWVGGGSQSTAGGIKVTTLAVAIISSMSFAKGKNRVDLMGRQLSADSINRANTTIFVSVIILISSIMTLSILEPNIPIMGIVYECVSALSTVGLSMNTTPLLSTDGKLVIITLMYIGRIGIITLLLGIISHSKKTKYNYPIDDVIIT